MNNLDFLLNHTYTQIIETATMIQEIKSSLKIIGYRLSSAIELILLIMKLRFK